MTLTRSKPGKWALLVMALGLMTYFLLFVYTRALNIPYQDDILDILFFLLRFTSGDSVREQLNELLAVYNIHRTASSRLLYYGLYLLDGKVDFRVYTVVANLALPLIAILYSCMESQRKEASLVLLIAALGLCQPGTYELVFFPVAAFSFYFLVLYAMASLLFIEKNSVPGLYLAALCALMASYTLLSGLLVWFVAGLYLVYQTYFLRNRRPQHIFFWVLAGLAVLVVFFADFSGSQTADSIWRGFLQQPQHELAYFFVLAGSGVGFGGVGISLAFGFLVVSGIGWFIYRDCRSGLSSLHFFAVFLLLSLIMVCLGRSFLADLDYTTHRYAFLSRNLFLCFILLLLARYRRSLVKLLLVVAMLVFWAVSYYLSIPQLERQLAARVELFNAEKYPVFFYSADETKQIIDEAESRGLYIPPDRPL